MTPFSGTTAFRLVRRLLLGNGSPAIYVLICEEGSQAAIAADLKAELAVAAPGLADGRIPELLDNWELEGGEARPIRVFRISRWSHQLVSLLDTHVIRLERTGAQFLFLASLPIVQQLLTDAPNFRSRVTDVLRMLPEDLPGGAEH